MVKLTLDYDSHTAILLVVIWSSMVIFIFSIWTCSWIVNKIKEKCSEEPNNQLQNEENIDIEQMSISHM